MGLVLQSAEGLQHLFYLWRKLSMFTNPVSWPIRIAIVLALIVACIVFGYVKGLQHEEKVFDTYKQQQQALADAQVVHTGEIVQQQRQQTEVNNNAFDQSILSVRDFYAGKLREQAPASSSTSVCTIPRATKIPAGTAADPVPVATTPDDKQQLAEQCAETTAQLVDAMHWAQEQQRIFNK